MEDQRNFSLVRMTIIHHLNRNTFESEIEKYCVKLNGEVINLEHEA